MNPTPRHRRRLAPWLLGLALAGAAAGVPPAKAQPPGPESFAKPPETPLENWEAADFLVRSGQAKLAVPYLNAFLKANPDDATLIAVRERFGTGSILRLQDDPATRPLAKTLVDRLNLALRRNATDPARIARFVRNLLKTPDERRYAIERLRESGPYAIPPLVRLLSDPSLSPESRATVVDSMGQLDQSAVPALIAVLDAPQSMLAADVADALGHIGDPRAVPFLTFPAASPDAAPSFREAAQAAIARLTGRPFGSQPRAPVRVLVAEAWRYHRHLVPFANDPAEVWTWADDAPASSLVPRAAAESSFGAKFAREALTLAPADRPAQVAFVSLTLDAASRSGLAHLVDQDPSGAFAAAEGAGPGVLADVLKEACDDGHPDLAAAACLALGRVADRDGLGTPDRFSPLVLALSNPDRRVQFAAAAALVDLNPSRPFPGSSRVVPTLARFVAGRSSRALVIDGNTLRGNSVASVLKKMGYDLTVVPTGGQGFTVASESADYEVILLEPSQLLGTYNAHDTIANLRADSRTAGIPIFLYGSLATRERVDSLMREYRRVGYVVTPTDAATTRARMTPILAGFGARALAPADREGFARAAAGLLAQVASRPNSPYAADLARVEPLLADAMTGAAAPGATVALGDVPGVDAQRTLADALLDPSRAPALRLEAGRSLARSVRRFGPLLTDEQETKVVASLDSETDPALKSALASVFGALRPTPERVGMKLRTFQPPQPEAVPKAPAPPEPETKPEPEAKPEADPKEKP